MYIYVLSKTCNNKRKLKIIAIVDTINEETFINKKLLQREMKLKMKEKIVVTFLTINACKKMLFKRMHAYSLLTSSLVMIIYERKKCHNWQ